MTGPSEFDPAMGDGDAVRLADDDRIVRGVSGTATIGLAMLLDKRIIATIRSVEETDLDLRERVVTVSAELSVLRDLLLDVVQHAVERARE